jgi:hypothetical protein
MKKFNRQNSADAPIRSLLESALDADEKKGKRR